MAGKLADPTGGVIIGVDMAHYAILEKDEWQEVPEYSEIIRLPHAKSIQITSNDSIQTAYYDNAPTLVAISKGEKNITFVKSDFSNKDLSAFLGSNLTAEGILIESGSDIPPYIAFGFRAETTKGHRYVWLLKGIMLTPDITSASKEASVTFQDQSINGLFVSRAYDGIIRIQVDKERGVDDTAAFAEEWFSLATLARRYEALDED